jgi:DNA-binding SARP family transcriptional activator
MMSTTSDCVLLFGALRVVAQRGDIPIPTGQAQSLLAYLCLYPRQLHARERLADLFWPHLAPERGRRALSDTLYRLRSLLGAHWFYSDAEHISLAERTDLWVDVWAFEAPPPSDVAALDARLALYTAPLLAGMYDDWLVARRVALEERHHLLLHRRAALAYASGDFALALQLYQQLIAVAPLHEAAYRGAMQALARSERLHQALDLYEQLTTLLADEVDAPPAESTRQLADQLYAELERLRRSAPPAPTPLFVGRGQERARLIYQGAGRPRGHRRAPGRGGDWAHHAHEKFAGGRCLARPSGLVGRRAGGSAAIPSGAAVGGAGRGAQPGAPPADPAAGGARLDGRRRAAAFR